MSDSTHMHATRRLSRVASEDRVINKPIAVAEQSRSYRDAGVQTLPPANGDVYMRVYGCEPAAVDHSRIGIGAIGRFTEGPNSNPYEPVYGVAYPASAKTEAECLDSGFQIAGCDATRLALTRAKARASMMANKYRKVAFEAGYKIWSEADNEMIVHSEQYPSTVRLDMQGNLLEGSTEGRYIPNISGAARMDTRGMHREGAPAIREETSGLVRGNDLAGTSKEVQQPELPQPALESPEITDEFVTEKIKSFAPSSSAVASESAEIAGDGYGSGKISDNVIVVHDATTANDTSVPDTTTTFIFSSGRQTFGDEWSNGDRAGKIKEPNVNSKCPIGMATPTSSSKKRRSSATRDSTKRVKILQPAMTSHSTLTDLINSKRPRSRDSAQRYANPSGPRKAFVRGESTPLSQRASTKQEVAGDNSEIKDPSSFVPAPQIAVEQSTDRNRVESPAPSRKKANHSTSNSRIQAEKGDSRQSEIGNANAKVSPSLSASTTNSHSVRRTVPNMASRTPPVDAPVRKSPYSKGTSVEVSTRDMMCTEAKEAPLSVNNSQHTSGTRQQGEHQSSGDDNREFAKAVAKDSTTAKTNGMQSIPGMPSASNQTSSDPDVKRPAPQPQRNRRPALAPYVPPALRDRARKLDKDKKTPKTISKR